MIVCTKSIDTLIRRSFGKEKIMVSGIDTIIAGLVLDPAVSAQSPVEVFIVGETEICRGKTLQKFQQAAESKHPDVKLIVVTRPRSSFTQCKGVDSILVNPKVEQLIETVSAVIEKVSAKVVQPAAQMVIPEYVPDNVVQKPVVQEEMPSPVPVEEPKEIKVEMPEEMQTMQSIIPDEQVTESIKDRIAACNALADVQILTSELNVASVVSDLMKENSNYVALEERINALKQKVYSIMLDNSIPTLSEKWERIRAIVLDKSYCAAQSTTVFESYVQDILSLLSSKTKELLDKKTEECNRVMITYKNSTAKEFNNYPRLSTLLNRRANMLLDIAATKKELTCILDYVKKFSMDVEKQIIDANTELTGMPLPDNNLRARGEGITTAEGLAVIKKILNDCCTTTIEFEEYQKCMDVLSKQMMILLEQDNELIESMSEIIQYLTANNLEDTIIKDSMIKQSLRLFVGPSGVGRSIIPYLISSFKSRQNSNVLHIDLTGRCQLSRYGIGTVSLVDWMEAPTETAFTVVESKEDILASEVSVLDRLMLILERAADYYRVINIVVSSKQKEIIDAMSADALSITYVTDMYGEHLDETRQLLETTRYNNVLQRLILNRCNGCTEQLVNQLGLGETLQMHYDVIPYLGSITDGGAYGINPVYAEEVVSAFAGVI